MTREEAIAYGNDYYKDLISACCKIDEKHKEFVRMALKALEQEPTAKNDLVVDAISRKQAIEEADKLCLETGYDNEKVIEMLNDLPSITPQPRKGHWIRISPAEIYECSECGQNVMTSDICVYKFCHGCGIKMVELQESEDKDEN